MKPCQSRCTELGECHFTLRKGDREKRGVVGGGEGGRRGRRATWKRAERLACTEHAVFLDQSSDEALSVQMSRAWWVPL